MTRFKPRLVRTVITIALAGWLAPGAVDAQDAGLGNAAEDEELPPELADMVPSPLENRLDQLEAREAERQQALDAALLRVSELEAARAQQEEEAEAAAEVESEEEDSGPDVRPIASMLTRFELREGYAANGVSSPGCFGGPVDSDCVRYRARLGLELTNLRVGDDVRASVRFVPQVTGFWSFGTPTTSGGVLHPSIALYEGSLNLDVADTLRVEIGRMMFDYGTGLVIGALGWNPAARAFDGARLRLTPDSNGAYIDAFFSLRVEGGAGDFGVGDTYFYGVYAGIGPALAEGLTLDIYVLGLQTNNSVDAVGTQIGWSLLAHIGSRLTYRVDIVDFRAEAGLQVGRRGEPMGTPSGTIIAGHIEAEVGLNLFDDRARVALLGLYASGDDPTTNETEAYNQLFPTGHSFLGLSDVMGARTNAGAGALRLSVTPVDPLRIALDVHVFMRPEAGLGDNYAGTEGDLQLIWTVGTGLRLRGLYALFLPNGGMFPTEDPVHYLEVELLYEYL